ncbi:3-hydroxyacyl-ACP dehydratase FabZ family protein [Glaciecola siphonariae]|uniref:3-hydroxyacyl-ACP dehydratase FabZ family protein n=1 Tax=Glaciecola siphonariae TaxID=521012 RepID=A0ABV9M055_9ALTE
MSDDKINLLSGLFTKDQRPEILSVDVAELKALITLHVPEDLSWFDGHFPEQKVLPGVVQIDWAGKFSKALLLNSERFSQLTNVKFKSMVMPNTQMSLELTYLPEKHLIKFHFFSEHDSFSSGSFKFLTP